MPKRRQPEITESTKLIKPNETSLKSPGSPGSPKSPDENEILSIIKQFTKKHIGLTAMYLFLVIFTTILGIVVVSKLTARFQKNIADADTTAGFRSLFIMMVVLLLSFVFGYVTDVLENKLFPMFQSFAQSAMFKLILKKNEANVESNVDANVYRQIMLRTSSSASHVYQQLLYTIIPNTMVLLVMFGFLFYSNWRYGMIFAAVATVVAGIALGAKNKIMDQSKCQEGKARGAEWKAFDVMFNMKLVASKNMVDREVHSMTQDFENVCTDKIEYLQSIDNLAYLVQTVSYVGVFFVFFLALTLFRAKLSSRSGLSKFEKDTESKKILTLISVLMGVRLRLQTLTKSQINTVDSIGKYGHIAEKVKAMHAKKIKQGHETTTQSDGVEFQNVHFEYGEKRVLQGVSLKVKPHECVAIQGQSGSGKTTLANTLMRNVDPSQGQVLVGGKPVGEYSLKSLKQIVSFVNPDLGILNRSIRENIMFGCPVDQVREKTEQAETLWSQFQETLFQDKQLDDPAGVGGGSELSTGQKTFVKLANVLVCGMNNVVILDEPTQGLDAKTKAKILELLNNIRKTRKTTMIIITHDEECAKIADRRVLMTNGIIVELSK